MPDVSVYEERLLGLSEVLGYSYYTISGYDLQGTQILVVTSGFFDKPVVLTEVDLQPYVRDVQAIAALLLE